MKRLELVRARKDVNRKVKALQADIEQAELDLVRHYKPITDPLKEFLKPKLEVKDELEDVKDEDVEEEGENTNVETKTPKRYGRRSQPEDLSQFELPAEDVFERVPETESGAMDIERVPEEEELGAIDTAGHNISAEVYDEYLNQYTGLAREYIKDMLEDSRSQRHDHKYGVRLDRTLEKFTIGNGQLHFPSDGRIILVVAKRKKKYKGTRGLFELLFKAVPMDVSQQDSRNYQEIIELTSAHKRNFDPKQQIEGNAGRKYLGVIKPMFFPMQGKGVMETLNLTNKRVEYIPYDNPNKLVDRLRVLLASQAAGHHGHDNEIIYLVAALRKAHYIE